MDKPSIPAAALEAAMTVSVDLGDVPSSPLCDWSFAQRPVL